MALYLFNCMPRMCVRDLRGAPVLVEQLVTRLIEYQPCRFA